MNNKGEITIVTILSAVFIGAFVLLCFSNIIGNLSSEYNITLSADESGLASNMTQQMSNVYSKTQEYQNSTQTASFEWGAATGLNLLSIYTMIKNFFTMFEVYNSFVVYGLMFLGLPEVFAQFLNGLIIIAFIGLVIALFLGRDKV